MQEKVINGGERIDIYLINLLGKSRSEIQKMIKNGNVLVNEQLVKNSYVVHENDILDIDTSYNVSSDVVPENIPLDIVYEDDDLLVVNKKSGMVVHPGCGNNSKTLVNALMYHCKNLSDINGDIRPGIVHRIDACTSGLLLIAKNNEAHNSLAKQLQEKTVTRKYIALVSGIIKEDTATIDAPIGRDKNDRKKFSVTSENSKDAITHIKALERYNNATLIECVLETGRTHQIRVHMKYINHPIINDDVYGINITNKEFGQMLHAKTIGFIHPKKKVYMEFSVEPPKEFDEILKIYKGQS